MSPSLLLDHLPALICCTWHTHMCVSLPSKPPPPTKYQSLNSIFHDLSSSFLISCSSPLVHLCSSPLVLLSSSAFGLTPKSHTMESSSVVSTARSLRRRGPMRYSCGEKPVVVVSWTADNPGKTFYSCPIYWVISNIRDILIFYRIHLGSIFKFNFRLNASVDFLNGMMMK